MVGDRLSRETMFILKELAARMNTTAEAIIQCPPSPKCFLDAFITEHELTTLADTESAGLRNSGASVRGLSVPDMRHYIQALLMCSILDIAPSSLLVESESDAEGWYDGAEMGRRL